MALLRTTWTDDDGSGTTGTVLNNAALQAIYDKLSLSLPSIAGGRLTLTSGTAVTTADVTAAVSVFYTPHVSAALALYDGVSAWNVLSFAETTLALGTLTSGLPYDVFAFNNSGTLALESLAWSTATARATALVKQDGVWVKTGATTRRYLGTFLTTSTTTTEDSFAKRYLWNYNNRVRRVMAVYPTTDSWAYTIFTFRQANASTANQIDCVVGIAEVAVTVDVYAGVSNTNAGVSLLTAIGEDSTTTALVPSTVASTTTPAANAFLINHAHALRYPAIGRHFYAWLEASAATGTTTWYGDNANAAIMQTGIFGTIEG